MDSGRLTLGRVKGGSVRLAEPADAGTPPSEDSEDENVGEPPLTGGDLYEPLSTSLKERWVRDQRFERSIVEITARQGRRDTGGTWTRPDLIVVTYTTPLYLPGRDFEVVTFEVKPWQGLEVTGVYEALAHRRELISWRMSPQLNWRSPRLASTFSGSRKKRNRMVWGSLSSRT